MRGPGRVGSERPGLWLGILIGFLAATAVGLGIAGVVLLIEDGDDQSPPPPVTNTTEIASEGPTTDAADLVLIDDAYRQYRDTSHEASLNAKQCDQATYGPQQPCYLETVKPIAEQAAAELASELSEIRDRVGPECDAALQRAELDAEAGARALPAPLIDAALEECVTEVSE
jgi:hypothetical protein